MLPVSVMEHVYRGGRSIAALRGGPARPTRSPEEWLGSVTTRFGRATDGLSRLPDGGLLRDAVGENPRAWLGAEHVGNWGDSPNLLVKLLDAGERLPIHLHPDRSFAHRHLSCCHGKTEAWVVLDAAPGTTTHLGFKEPVTADELTDLVSRQDTEGLLSRMHEVPLHTGDAVLIPSGLPHALGQGAFVAEVQEPTDFSIMLNWAGLPLDGEVEGHLGLGFPLALEAVTRTALTTDEIEDLFVRGALLAEASNTPLPLLPLGAAPFFRADLLTPPREDPTGAAIPADFAVLLVLEGRGHLRSTPTTPSGPPTRRTVARGDAFVLPHYSGPHALRGDVRALLFRPPHAP
ncbi:class I mannose-6-phosphate isomerase [Spiractinospora alimapuensis]|uniref:class I mannose-6-phosphate isomerase n=1 Tax=Spiractinospora alimapuensis TaxID=2820884 RepID=UPI001F455C90|nr:class I mannose-6-phosphate isomerase [Spiractinospora alimapuensis]QVQ54462.1 class I mannose-6-phosphate isomerase [Spiractinospora alimapuensis]